MALQCRRAFPIAVIFLLLMISGLPAQANGEAKVSNFSFASMYTGSGDGELTLELRWLDYEFVVAFATTSITGRCFGSTSGIGRFEGRSLRVSNIWMLGGPTCTLQIDFDESGRKAIMNEEQECPYFHGVSCGFNGTLVATPSP